MRDQLTKFFNFVITGALLCLIVVSVGAVLIRGLPQLIDHTRNSELLFALKLSLLTSVVSTFMCLLVAVPVAYTLTRYRFPGQGVIASIIRIPLTMPPIVSGVCLLLFLGTTVFGEALSRIGMNFIFTVPGIIMAQFFVNVPSLITVLKAAIENIDVRLDYVARTLGCSALEAFLRVDLPLMRKNIVAGLVLTWGKALGEFGAVLMVAGATRFRTETLPTSIYLNMATGDMGAVMASTSILILIGIAALVAFELLAIENWERTRVL